MQRRAALRAVAVTLCLPTKHHFVYNVWRGRFGNLIVAPAGVDSSSQAIRLFAWCWLVLRTQLTYPDGASLAIVECNWLRIAALLFQLGFKLTPASVRLECYCSWPFSAMRLYGLVCSGTLGPAAILRCTNWLINFDYTILPYHGSIARGQMNYRCF